MTKKIIVADDSLTIQKVINITLANSDFELITAHSEQELFEALGQNTPILVLLDNDLSENKTGTELSIKIKENNKSLGIILMLGTFDNVSKEELKSANIDDSIVKPFDSTLFIQKCNTIADSYSMLTVESVVSIESKSFQEEDEEWQMNPNNNFVTKEEVSFENNVEEINIVQNGLGNELSEWGIQVPPKISEEAKNMSSIDIPVIIDNENINLIPSSDDLEYPQFDKIETVEDNLSGIEDTSPNIINPLLDQEKLEEEIDDDMDKEDFWAADEASKNDNEDKKVGPETIDTNIELNTNSDDEIIEEAIESPIIIPVTTPSINQEEIIEKIMKELMPNLEKIIKEQTKESIDKIAWEIIPELAENLIKKEIKNISDSVK